MARYGVGLDNIQISDYLKVAIDVVNFPKFCTEEVADHATALIMFLYRRLDILFSCDDLNNYWGKPDLIDGLCSADNTTIGIVGIGNIGSSVAKRLLSYGFNVIAYDPYVDCFEGVKMVSMDHLFSNSDVLSIHCPLNEETEGMIDLKNKLKYDLKINKEFKPTKKNRMVLANLLYNFPINKEYYIRSRTLSNALQVVFNLGFRRVSYIGFMDSITYKRDEYGDQKKLIKFGKKKGLKLGPAYTRSKDFLSRSFLYQSQIMRTLEYVYEKHGRELVNLNPSTVK